MAENNKGNLKHKSCAPDARMTRLRTRSAVQPKHTPASCNTADGLHGDNSEPKPGTSSDHQDTASSSSGRKTRSCSRSRSKKASSSVLEGDGVVKKRSRSGGKAAKKGSAVNNFTKVKSRNRTNSESATSSIAPETGPGVHSEAASTSGISNPLKGKMNIGSAATASCSSDTTHTATSQTVKGKSRPRKKAKLDTSDEQGIVIEKRRSLRLREIYELKPSLDVVEFRSYQSGVLADSDHLNKLSIEVMCHIFQFLTLKELLRLESMSSKIQQAVRIILTSVTEIDFLEDVRDIRLFEDGLTKLTNKALMALVTKIPKLRTIKNFHPANLAYGVFDLKLNTYGLTVLGIVWAFMSSKTLEGIEISNIHLLTRVIVDLPHLNILGRFANRERVFPTDPDVPWCNLRDECRITNLHLVGCVVSHLPPMDNHLQHLYLRFVKFMHPQGHPFKDFSACKLKTFVMSHCIGPVSTLKYIPLLTALADATSLTCLELQRVPFLGGVIQHICDDNWQNGGFRRLSSIKMGACKNALDADLGFLAIAAAPYLETLQIQPSLTKDAFFYALSMAGITVNPAFNKLCIGWTDVFPDKDKWSNNQLLAEGFAEEGDSLARISDAGMKIMGTTFMNTSTLEISGCPHLNNPLNWLTAGQLSFRNVTDLTLRDCHAMDLEKLCAFVTCLSSLEYLTLQDMVPEPPIGCSRVGLSAGTGLGAAKSLLNPPANPGPPADDLDDPPDRQEVRAQFLGHRHVRDAAVHAGNAPGNAGNAAVNAGNAAGHAGNQGHDGNESESANENEENRLENDRRSRIKRRNRHKSSRRHRSENDGNSSHNLRSSRSSRRRRSSSKRSRRRSSQSGDSSYKAEAPSNGNHRDKHRKRSKRSRRRHVPKHDNDSDSNEEGSSHDQDSNSGGGQPSCSGATRSRSSRSETSHTRPSSKHDDDADNTSIHNQPSVSHATRSRSFTRCDKNIQANSENNDSDDQQGTSRRKGDIQGSPGSRSVERSNQRSQGSGQKSNRSGEGASRLHRGSSHDDDDGGAETQNRAGASKRGKALVTKRGLVCKVKKRKGVEDTAGNCGKRDEKQERTQKPKIVCTCKVETRDVGCQLGSEDLKTFAQNPQRSRRRSKLVTAGQFKPSLTRPSTVVTKCLKHPYIKSRPKPCQRHQNDGTSDPIWEEDPKRSFFVFHSHIKYIKFDNVGITDLDIGATNIHTISITRCRVLKNIKFMSAPMLQNIHVSQCPKFDEMGLIQEIRNIPPNTSKFVSLRPMHVDMIYIPNKFTSCGENPFGTAVMYDHSPTPSLTHYNKLRMKAWKPLLERITMSAMKDYGWKLDRDLEYPENNIDHIKAQSVDGSLLKVATDIPWIKMLTECKNMEPQNISDPEWLKDGAYCMEAKGHFSFHDAYEDIQEAIAKHPNNLYGLSECNILVYINTCDISGTPNPDAFALL